MIYDTLMCEGSILVDGSDGSRGVQGFQRGPEGSVFARGVLTISKKFLW